MYTGHLLRYLQEAIKEDCFDTCIDSRSPGLKYTPRGVSVGTNKRGKTRFSKLPKQCEYCSTNDFTLFGWRECPLYCGVPKSRLCCAFVSDESCLASRGENPGPPEWNFY